MLSLVFNIICIVVVRIAAKMKFANHENQDARSRRNRRRRPSITTCQAAPHALETAAKDGFQQIDVDDAVLHLGY